MDRYRFPPQDTDFEVHDEAFDPGSDAVDEFQGQEAPIVIYSMTPPGLVRIIADLPATDALPDDKEIAVGTEMEFDLPDGWDALRGSSIRFPRVDDAEGSLRFRYTPVPAGTRSAEGTPGKVQGEVSPSGDRVVAITLTLSMAARMIVDLRAWLGPRIRLASVRWTSSVTGQTESARFDGAARPGDAGQRAPLHFDVG